MERPDQSPLMTFTVEITSAYLTNNAVRSMDVPGLIVAVHGALARLGTPKAEPLAAVPLTPAVPIRKSVTDDFIISLEDGRKLKTMKRYLAKLGMTPADYRAKWGLPADYPTVAPAYAKARSEVARTTGLGLKRGPAAEPAPGGKAKRGRPAQTA